MTFVAGAGTMNVDLLYSGLPRVPGEGEELFSSGFAVRLGGGIPATLLNLRGLNVPVALQTAWGDDLFSRFAVEQVRTFGLTPVNLWQGGGIPLNVSTVILTPGDRTFVSYGRGIPPGPDTDRIIFEQSRGAAFVQMGAGSPEVYRRLKEEGAQLLFDTGWSDDLSLERCREQLLLADYYTPNQKEALKITQTDTPEAAAEVLSRYFPRVIVKLDRAGCLIQENGVQRVIPSIPGITCVDSTGAGDAFTAGLLYGLYHGCTFAECVLLGNITGGTCVTGEGCLTRRCTEEELLRQFREYHSFAE